jgi:hypothetical protein
MFWADVGRTGPWGIPGDLKAKSKWPFYAIGALASEPAFDFYMVDGRFQVACACAEFLHASSHKRDPHTFLMAMHDFSKRWKPRYSTLINGTYSYGDIWTVADRVRGFDPTQPVKGHGTSGAQIVVLRRKQGVSDAEIVDIYTRHKEVVMRRARRRR